VAAGADSGMPANVDFSHGTHGQFFRTGSRMRLPVYLDEDVQAYLSARAQARGIDLGPLVNELLRKDIELIEAAR
jgi:hypothetical protein